MLRNRPAIIQLIAGFIALAIGVLVYLLDRSSTSVYFIPDSWSPGENTQPVFGWIGNYLPTFAHTIAFTLFTSALLEPWRWSAPVACAWWWIVDSLLEIAQGDTWAEAIAAHVPGWFDDWLLLDNVAGYFRAGRYDPADLASIAIAAVSAFLVIRLSHRAGFWRIKKGLG